MWALKRWCVTEVAHCTEFLILVGFAVNCKISQIKFYLCIFVVVNLLQLICKKLKSYLYANTVLQTQLKYFNNGTWCMVFGRKSSLKLGYCNRIGI